MEDISLRRIQKFMPSSTAVEKLSMATAGAVFIALSVGGVAQAAVLTFDDIVGPIDLEAPIPNGYGGFTWDNFDYLDSSNSGVPSPGYETGAVSGKYVAFNAKGEPATVKRSSVFDFKSAYMTAAFEQLDNVFKVEGLKDGVTLYSQTVSLDTTSPTLVNFNYSNVDELKFSTTSRFNEQFVVDNFTYQAVPEPTSALGTLAFGVFGATAAILKRKNYQRR